MRQLHPVSLHEKFVASGIYRPFRDHNPMGLVEHWSIHEQPDNAQIIRVDQDGREIKGRSLLLEAWRNPDGNIERLDALAFGDLSHGDEAKVVKSKYLFFEDSVHISRIVDDQSEFHIEMSLPGGYKVVPSASSSANQFLSLFLGFGIAQAAQKFGERMNSFTPSNLFKQNDDKGSYGMLLKIGSLYKGDGMITVGDEAHHVRGYDLIGHEPISGGQPPIFWLDKYDVLIKSETFFGASQIIALTQYARRLEPKKHT